MCCRSSTTTGRGRHFQLTLIKEELQFQAKLGAHLDDAEARAFALPCRHGGLRRLFRVPPHPLSPQRNLHQLRQSHLHGIGATVQHQDSAMWSAVLHALSPRPFAPAPRAVSRRGLVRACSPRTIVLGDCLQPDASTPPTTRPVRGLLPMLPARRSSASPDPAAANTPHLSPHRCTA